MPARNSVRLVCLLLTLAACTCSKSIKPTSVTPEGDLEELPNVVRIQFDTPLYDPAATLPQMPPPKVVVTPALPFRVAVSSPTSVDVTFSTPPAPATEYTVTLDAGLESFDHKARLKDAVSVKFRTPRNDLERVSTTRDEGGSDEDVFVGKGDALTGAIAGLGPKQPLNLRFRYPVSTEHFKKLVQLYIDDGKLLPFTASPRNDDGSVWSIAPDSGWPRDTKLRLVVSNGLTVDRAGAGPLATEKDRLISLHTWGPLTVDVARMGGAECVSPKVLPLIFSNPVGCSAVLPILTSNVSETTFKCVSEQSSRRVRIEATPPLPGAHQVVLKIAQGLTDAYGETLSRQIDLPFQTCLEGAAFAYQKPFVILDPGQSTTHVERLTGADALKVEGKRLGLPELWALLRTQELADQVAWTALPWWLSEYGFYDWEDEGDGEGDWEPHERNRKLPGEMARAAVDELKNAQSVTVPLNEKIAVTHGKTDWRDVSVDLEQFLGGKHGLLLIRTTPMLKTGQAAASPVLRVINATDIGLSARLSNDTLVVLAATYSGAKPIEGVEIALQTEDGKAVGNGTTGADGLLSLPAANFTSGASLAKTPLLISAKKGDDEAFLWTRFLSDRSGLWMRNTNHLLGNIYADRGIYRPGEKVHLHGIVRFGAANGFTNPAGQTARLVIRAPDYSEFLARDVTLSEFGSFNDLIDLPDSAKLGQYSIDFTLANESLQGTFRLGDYRPAEMKVEVHSPESVMAGDKLRATIQGDYLFGAPAARRPIRWSLMRTTEAYHSARYPNAVFWSSERDEWWQRPSYTTISDGTAELDEKGSFSLIQPMGKTTPSNQHDVLSINASLDDANGQTISTQKNIDLFSSKVLVGIERTRYLVPMKEKSQVTIIVLDHDDKPVANVEVQVRSTLQGWRSVRRQGPSGGVYWSSERVKTTEKVECRGKSNQNGELICEFTPEMGGDLKLTAEAKDGTGNAKATTWIWVYGDSNYWAEGSDRYESHVLLDRPEVKAGETAKVAITSPFREGYALVTVEREDVLWKKAFPIGTSGTVDIPTEMAWAPNVQIVATVVRARVSSAKPDPEHDKPAYAVGRAELKVRPTTAALNVKVATAQLQLEPGQSQTVSATVTGSDGAPVPGAEVNLWAVNEGVLMLTDYKTPNVLTSMFQQRGWSTIGLDTRQYILGKRVFIEPVVKGEEDGGGGGVEDEDSLRKNFDPLAVWVGSAVTNGKGVVESTFTVPDSLTTYRVMATAVSKDDRFGQGDAQFKVNKMLMLRQSLPRFARPGDTFTAGVLVNHLSSSPAEVTVQLESFDDKLFTLSGPKEQKVTVAPNETKPVLFQFKANDATGASELHFVATMTGHKDRVELKLPVIRLVPRESVAASGVVSSGTFQAELSVPPNARATAFEVNASGTPISALEGRLRDMVDYPYGCLEQRTSKVLPLVAIRELAGKLGMQSIPTEKIKGWVAEYVTLVPRYRCSDGGFDYWPGCHFGSSTYLTSFALDGLLTVKRYGFEVPQGEIDRTVDYLKRQVEAGSLGKDEYGSHGHNAGGMMSPLRVLAEAGTSLPQVEKASFDGRAAFPLFAKAELTRAMGSRLGQAAASDSSVKTLLSEIGSEGKEHNGALTFDAKNAKDHWWAWESEQHNTALVLRTLLQVTPADSRVPLLIKGLVDLNNANSYYITSDTTETLLGLVEAVDKLKIGNDGTQATIKAGGQTLATTKALGAREETFSLPAEQLKGTIPLEITSTGKSPVYFGAFLTYSYPPSVYLPAASNGFIIRRTYQTQKGLDLAPAKGATPTYTVHVGDVIKVNLTVDVDDEGRIVVIEDPLPAGLEAIDTALATSERKTVREDGEDARNAESDEEGWQSTYQRELYSDRTEWHLQYVWKHRQELSYLARASTPGTYHVPGTHAERMYQPAINGRGESCDFVVLPKE